jgi:threonine aldolase
MRQAGVAAAAGLYALEHHVVRLREDHARASRLAEGVRSAGIAVRNSVETNCVQFDIAHLSATAEEVLRRLESRGVLLSGTSYPSVIRAVSHLDVSDTDVERSIDVIASTLHAGDK